jgi:DNA-binding transcriptional MerR regulator
MMAKSYTNKQISEKTGLSQRLIQFYTQEGVVVAEIDAGTGRGSVRRYSEKNLFQFALVAELSFYGIKISTIKSVMKFVEPRLSSDFFAALEAEPILSFQRRLPGLEMKEVTAMITDRAHALNLKRDISGLGIDLYELYKRQCLGVGP